MPLNKLVAVRQRDEPMPLTELLRAKSSIRQLEIHGEVSDWDLERLKEEDLPILESLAARVGPAKVLVPGRPIRSVELHDLPNETEDGDIWIKISHSSDNVSMLDLWEWNSDQLKQAAGHLPGIRHLRLRGRFIKVEEVIKAVSYFPHLETLDVTTLATVR